MAGQRNPRGRQGLSIASFIMVIAVVVTVGSFWVFFHTEQPSAGGKVHAATLADEVSLPPKVPPLRTEAALEEVVGHKPMVEAEAQHPDKPVADATTAAAKGGWHLLPSGMKFLILTRGTGKISPTKVDKCVVHYVGKLTNGKKFDSSYDRGQPAQFAPNGVIRGWTEALQMMRAGDKWKVEIPPNLAYGDRGFPPVIPPKSTLVFTIELVKVLGPGRSFDDAVKDLEAKTKMSYDQL